MGLFLKYLNVYTKTDPTPSPDEIVVMIVVELLTIIALATRELMQGQLSTYAHPDLLIVPYFIQRSELRDEASRRAGCRGNPTTALSTRPTASSDDRIANSQGDLWRRPASEGCYGL